MRTTPENITELAENEVFVFGSNLLGVHGRGAARTARMLFGARTGTGEGMVRQSYAFPTLSHPTQKGVRKLSRERLEQARDLFFYVAREHPDLTFLLTKVGCGLAGYEESEMISLFADSPENVVKPPGW